MSMLDKMMEENIERAKEMQKRLLDMQEELYSERGEQIERINKKKEELSAAGTKIHYEAAASGVKEGLEGSEKKFCTECGKEISASAKYCSECGAKQ